MSTDLPEGFRPFVEALKAHIRESQVRAALAVNRTLLTLYWNIGRAITERQEAEGWGARVIDHLADEIQRAFPGVGGFSRPNIYRMRAFYLAYPAAESASAIVSQAVRQFAEPLPPEVPDLPWGHIVTLQRLKDPPLRQWYARAAVEGGWSRAVLLAQIDTRLHEREGAAITNFARTLPPPRSDLAQQSLKDPYVFDFLTLGRDAQERDLEAGLVAHVERFLMELGVGFAFVGRQVHLQVGEQDFYLDLLFYHLKLRCFVVVELKAVAFEPEFAGKMNFYLSAVDAQMRHPSDGPSLGVILCRGRDRVVVEYALRDVQKPIGVAEWETRLVASLPQELEGALPSVEQLEAELGAAGASEENA
ncbi:MAG: PDDEXK nuclease domain-containing protein [Deltaproteobacteria bacterium]|nr:PDDEXK nuclease domain-containing protein [Myxococcales bacterium]MDP3217959.1 PDDEXK nuclease domain-containing protein [Deltaproteobacteria bacterium]